MKKRIVKKIIVILIIITMLQTQVVSLANIVYAITTEASGMTNEVIKNETMEGMETESTGNITEGEPTEEPVEETKEVIDEESIEEPSEEVPSVEEPAESAPQEETSEEILEEVPEVIEPKLELNIRSENSSIYKGYLYANATSDLRYETNYNTIEEVIITGSTNGINSVIVTENEDKIKMITATKLALLNDIYYKKTRVSVEEFNKILGENGIINIYDADGDYVGNINKDTAQENGYLVYEYIYYTNNVKFELSSPIADGMIKIVNDKAIKEDSLYSREQIATFSSINITATAEMTVGEQVLKVENEGDISLQETESKVQIELDKTELSTEKENELTITLTLKTDAERYELFKNPIMEIEMPSNVNEMEIEGVNLLYKNGLSLDSWEVVENDNGHKVLRIKLAGAQSVYTPGILQEGTTVVVYAKVLVNKLTANTSENLKLTYTNQDSVRQAYKLEGKEAEEIVLNFIAKHGMLKGMAGKNEATQALGNSYEEEVDKIEVKSGVGEQIVTIKGTVVNNFEKETNDVVIVGRIPFIGNKNGDGDELLSDFDTILKSEVTTTGNLTEVYYSEDGEATKDADSWSQDTSDMSKYKSYKIVVKEGTLKKGERVEFVYEAVVPENLGYNLRSYATYTVIYKLDNQELQGNCTLALVSKEKELTTDDLENKEEVAELEIGTQVSQGGKVLTAEDSVYERQILKYTVVVTNPSSVPVTNIKLTGRAENANMYNWKYIESENYYGHDIYVTRQLEEDIDGTRSQDEFIIETLAPGESKSFQYQVITKMLPEEVPEEGIEVYGIVAVSADNMETKQIETIRNKVVDAKLEVRLGYAGTEDLEENDAKTGGDFKIYVYIKNISDVELNDLDISIIIPNELDYELDYYSFNMEGLDKKLEAKPEGKVLTVHLPKLAAGGEKDIYVSTIVKNYDLSIAQRNVTLKSYVTVDDEKYMSNDYTKLTKQSKTSVEYDWIANAENDTLINEQEVTYTFTIKNTGLAGAGYLKLKNEIPSGFELVEAKILKNNEENEVIIKEKIVNGYVELNSGEEASFILKYKVNKNLFERDQDVIENKVEISEGLIDSFATDVITYKIHNENVTVEIPEEPKENDNKSEEDKLEDNDSENDKTDISEEEKPEDVTPKDDEDIINKPEEIIEEKKTYIVSGRVWLDKNKDGINNNESGEKAVVVVLYKTTEKGNITSKVSETITNQNGEYIFNGVENGTYVVVFYYDTGVYNSTKYKVSTATTSENSDVITKAVNLDGSSTVVGITDVISIQDAGAINVDLGLVDKNEFDLSLEKYVNNVTVKNEEGTKTYNYEESENVKVEIRSRYYKDSIVEITYKIRINNTGEVSGYVNRIVDYVPEDMKFDNNKNPDWYYGDDGNLYYKGLVGKEMQAGESQEISLVLTKTLENGEAVKLVNGAEIAESTNSMGLEDIDSVPGNKEQKEDDFGKVTLTITISTGDVANNVIALILTLIITIIIIYMVKLKFSKKVYR